MKLKAYSVYDAVAEVFTQPFFQLNDMTAQRIIQNAVNSEGHNYNMNPEDYSLYCVGEWDDTAGVFTPVKTKKLDLVTLLKQNALNLVTHPAADVEDLKAN